MKEKIQNSMKRKIIVSILVLVIIVLAVNFVFPGKITGLLTEFLGDEEKELLTYMSYKQVCEKEDWYFEKLAEFVGGTSKKVREIKWKSSFCTESEIQNMTMDEFEHSDLNCECQENNIRTCPTGWEMDGGFCKLDNKFTNPFKLCSFYKCEEDYYVEVIVNEEKEEL